MSSKSFECVVRAVVAVFVLGFLQACSPSESPPAKAPAPSEKSAPAAPEPEPAAPEPAAPAKPTKETACDDGADEDGDGKTDCKDPDCMPAEACQIAHCQEVCANIMACDSIVESCSDEEHAGVLKGCQQGCADDPARRSQLSAADGVPCFMIAGMFLDQVQQNGLCGGEKPAAADGA